MKKRSEVLKDRSAKAESKSSAESRTEDLPLVPADAMVHCDACEADSTASQCTTRADGKAECPECGAPVLLATPETKGKAKNVENEKSSASSELKDPHRKYCGECGVEWPIVEKDGYKRFWINCGHERAFRIEDPRKAKNYGPPAGLQTRSDKEVERLNAEDAKRESPKEEPKKETPVKEETKRVERRVGDMSAQEEPRVVIDGRRVSVTWGKSVFPFAPHASMTLGEIFLSTMVPEGGDVVGVAQRMIAECKEIASSMFSVQRKWYEEKFESLTR